MQELERVQQLGDYALLEELIRSAKHDRQLTVRLLAELGEVHARGLFRDLGFSTMFDYATRKLGMSEAEAALRLRAAKLGRTFPLALEMLGRSELNLTTLSLLAPVLTPDTLHLLQEVRFLSKPQVLAVLAKHAAKPDVPDSIRKLPRPSVRAPHAPTPPLRAAASRIHLTHHTHPARCDDRRPAPLTPTPTAAPATSAPTNSAPTTSAVPKATPRPTPATTSTAVTLMPLSADRHKVTFTASQRVCDLIAQARDLRRHRYPGGDFEPLIERALELLVADEQRRRFGRARQPRTTSTTSQNDQTQTTREGHLTRPTPTSTPESTTARLAIPSDAPRTAPEVPRLDETRTTPIAIHTGNAPVAARASGAKPHSRHIPNAVRRQVWARDEGRCCFHGADDVRCTARGLLEFHHVIPFARAGAHTADNIVLMCKPHNALCAERDYSREFIQACIANSRRPIAVPQS